ncbi:DNRLRE domain-containing protein [Rapidithrix thailandica]|uniref:DNRLRE domain-containing protein n=1 Tax=Rapidithrix thailandica TaxID=413964 RepID=A0AAW9S5Y5_9BACT
MKNNCLKWLGAIHLMLSFSIVLTTTGLCQNAQIWKKYTGEITDPDIPLLPDYSFAGYMRGEVALPETSGYPVFDVTDPAYGAIPNDTNSDQAAIQAAIDAAEANGGGVVFFPPGEYLVNSDPNNTSPIVINASNIILKGSGSTPGGTVINMKNYMRLPSGWPSWGNSAMFEFYPVNVSTQGTAVTKDANRGDYTVQVKNASIFQNEKFCELRMQNNTAANNDFLDGKSPRSVWTTIIHQGVALEEVHEIDSVDLVNNILHLKDPIIDDIKAGYKWGAQTIDLLENCGFEDIHFKANFTDPFVHHKDYIHDYGWKGIKMAEVAHSWVRRSRFSNVSQAVAITSSSYASSILNILVDGNSGHSLTAVDGGSSRVLQGLIWDNTYHGQFHGADMSGRACGSVVWRVDARKGKAMDLHGSMPRTNLIDRYIMMNKDGAGGHYANLPNHLTGLTMWNIERVGNGSVWYNLWNDCGGNYCGLTVVNPIVVGYHGGGGAGFDQNHVKYEESNGTKVFPESLYEAQLEYRLGTAPSWVSQTLNEWDSLRTAWYTLELVGDAYVRNGNYANTNYGHSDIIEVKNEGGSYERRGYFCFDVSGIGDVSSVKLQLTPSVAGYTDYNLKFVPNDGWKEYLLTWNNMPAPSYLIGIQQGGSGPIEWDITNEVISEKNGDGYLSMELGAVSSGVYGSFYSKDYHNPDLRPKLIIGKKDQAISPAQDAFIRSGAYADNNYNISILEIKSDGWNYTRDFYMGFDLSNIEQEIVGAKVKLTTKIGTTPGGGTNHHVRFVQDDSWDESTVTWNNGPAYGNFLDTQTTRESGSVVLFDVTAQAETERQGDGYLSLSFSADNNAYVSYHASEAATESLRSVLELTFAGSGTEQSSILAKKASAPSKIFSTPFESPTKVHFSSLKETINLYPNPSDELINIEWNEPIGAYQIMDVNGLIIKSKENVNEKTMAIDIRNLSAGVYVIVLTGKSGDRISKTFIKG